MKITENTSIPIKSIVVLAVFCVWLARIESRDEKYEKTFKNIEAKITYMHAKHDKDISEIKEVTWKSIDRILNRLDDIANRLARIEGSLKSPEKN